MGEASAIDTCRSRVGSQENVAQMSEEVSERHPWTTATAVEAPRSRQGNKPLTRQAAGKRSPTPAQASRKVPCQAPMLWDGPHQPEERMSRLLCMRCRVEAGRRRLMLLCWVQDVQGVITAVSTSPSQAGPRLPRSPITTPVLLGRSWAAPRMPHPLASDKTRGA